MFFQCAREGSLPQNIKQLGATIPTGIASATKKWQLALITLIAEILRVLRRRQVSIICGIDFECCWFSVLFGV
jgi:hypothetical protein